jgi:hypothetical protein
MVLWWEKDDRSIIGFEVKTSSGSSISKPAASKWTARTQDCELSPRSLFLTIHGTRA